MSIILWIIGGLVVLGILKAIGAIQEIFMLIGLNLLAGGIAALMSWIFGWDAGLGFRIGVWVGAGIYGLLCITRIINPEIEITLYSDGSSEECDSRISGIVGIVVLGVATVIALS